MPLCLNTLSHPLLGSNLPGVSPGVRATGSVTALETDTCGSSKGTQQRWLWPSAPPSLGDAEESQACFCLSHWWILSPQAPALTGTPTLAEAYQARAGGQTLTSKCSCSAPCCLSSQCFGCSGLCSVPNLLSTLRTRKLGTDSEIPSFLLPKILCKKTRFLVS